MEEERGLPPAPACRTATLTRLVESGRDDDEARAEWASQYARFRIRLAELLSAEQAAALDATERSWRDGRCRATARQDSEGA